MSMGVYLVKGFLGLLGVFFVLVTLKLLGEGSLGAAGIGAVFSVGAFGLIQRVR